MTPTNSSSPPNQRRQRVQAAETSVGLLKSLASLGGKASLTGLSHETGESAAKVHRYLVSLVREGLVAQDSASQQYFLSSEAIKIGLAAMRQADPIRAGEASLVRLRSRLHVTCFIAVMGNKGPTILRFEEPGLPVTVNVRAGSVLSPLWSATGQVFLGYLDEPEVRAMADRELAEAPREMLAQLDRHKPIEALRKAVISAGCASVRDTYLRGISAVAAPVFDCNGNLCGVLTALGASGGFDPNPTGEIARAVMEEARVISSALGSIRPSGKGVPSGQHGR